MCAGDVTLDCKRTAHKPLAYWFGSKRYTEAELKGGCKFKTDKSDLYLNLDFTADVINAFTDRKVGSGKWFWVNLSDWGGCLGDYGTGGFKYPTAGVSGNVKDYIKGMIPNILLKNIKPKDSPSRDYNIENALSGKAQRPLETFKDVKQVTENLKSEAKSATAERANAQKQSKNGKSQSVDDLLNSTGHAKKQQDLDALLGSTGYSKQEQTNRNIEQADAAAANITSFSDLRRVHKPSAGSCHKSLPHNK
ncbi:hypothetical protein FACS1894182_00660 [Bacteroidia bacterium]|nr:hypothetical protein FACS1894182_00660 [Bacteroidia bacterium]